MALSNAKSSYKPKTVFSLKKARCDKNILDIVNNEFGNIVQQKFKIKKLNKISLRGEYFAAITTLVTL